MEKIVVQSLFTLAFIHFGLSSKRILNQFEASCFTGCRCNSTSFVCQGLKQRTTELFRQVHPLAYPDLDTLIVTGNDFGTLLDENIFGSNSKANIRHRKLTLVNISDNAIRSFGAQTFIGMPRVEYFYLANNMLESIDVVDLQPFNYFTSLKYLDLSNLFGVKVSAKGRAKIVKTLFSNNHSFIDLQDVLLPSNGLEYLEPDTFCSVKGLSKLVLSNNKLTKFEYTEGCLDSLHVLDLSGNRVNTVPVSLMKLLPSLDTIDFSSNPLICDCDLAEFHEFALDERDDFLNQDNTVCSAPKQLAGQKLFEIDSVCQSFKGFAVWHWLFLLFVASSAFFVYKRFLHQRIFSSKSSQLAPLLVEMEGYSRLNALDETTNNENLPPPVFV